MLSIKLNKKIKTKKEKDPEIPIDSEHILQRLSKQDKNFLPKNIPVSKTIPVDEKPNPGFIINYHKPTDNNDSKKIKIEFESLGTQGTDANESIIGTIKLNINEELINAYLGNGGMIIKKPEGLNENCSYNEPLKKDCSYTIEVFDSSNLDYDIKGVTALVNGSLNLNDNKKQIGSNSLLYITEDAYFGELNGNLDTSKLYIGGNATFGNIKGGIKHNSILFIGGNATFGVVNGGGR